MKTYLAPRLITTTLLIATAILVGASDPNSRVNRSTDFPSVHEAARVAYNHNDQLPHQIQWNMCNTAPWCNNSGADMANALWGALQQNPVSPAAVALQEICRADLGQPAETYDTLLAAFTWTGHKGHYQTTKSNPNGCDNVGVAIFWAGGCHNNQCRTNQRYQVQDNDGETRRNVCGRAAWPGFMACSTHIDTQVAGYQIAEYTPFLHFMDGIIPTFGLGDFNVHPPWNPAYDGLYTHWRESDGCRDDACWRYTYIGIESGNLRKFDYVWFPTGSHCIEHQVQLINKAESDHHLMRAYPGTPPCP